MVRNALISREWKVPGMMASNLSISSASVHISGRGVLPANFLNIPHLRSPTPGLLLGTDRHLDHQLLALLPHTQPQRPDREQVQDALQCDLLQLRRHGLLGRRHRNRTRQRVATGMRSKHAML